MSRRARTCSLIEWQQLVLGQYFSTLTLLPFWAEQFFAMWAPPVDCTVFGSTPSHWVPVTPPTPSCANQKCHWPNVPEQRLGGGSHPGAVQECSLPPTITTTLQTQHQMMTEASNLQVTRTQHPHNSLSQGHIQGAPQWSRFSIHLSGLLSSLLCHVSEMKLGQRDVYNRYLPNHKAAKKLCLILLLYLQPLVENSAWMRISGNILHKTRKEKSSEFKLLVDGQSFFLSLFPRR